MKIVVKVGDQVNTNDPLFIIEAMKMESTITAPYPAIVRHIELREKSRVDQDDLIIKLEKIDQPAED